MTNIEKIAAALDLEFEIYDAMKTLLDGTGTSAWHKTGVRLTNDLLDDELTDGSIDYVVDFFKDDILKVCGDKQPEALSIERGMKAATLLIKLKI